MPIPAPRFQAPMEVCATRPKASPGTDPARATGEILRELVIDPTKVYQPTGRAPGPAWK